MIPTSFGAIIAILVLVAIVVLTLTGQLALVPAILIALLAVARLV